MATLAADMTDSQRWIPLSTTDASELEFGYYTVDDESIKVLGLHRP